MPVYFSPPFDLMTGLNYSYLVGNFIDYLLFQITLEHPSCSADAGTRRANHGDKKFVRARLAEQFLTNRPAAWFRSCAFFGEVSRCLSHEDCISKGSGPIHWTGLTVKSSYPKRAALATCRSRLLSGQLTN